jgi:small subunit ribosomal protein S4
VARYLGPKCRLCRREGVKLYLKGDRCYSDKCAIERAKPAPGQHGVRRGKLSDYGVQLREKQKLRRIYGVLEKQFRGVFEKSSLKKGKTGELLLQSMELRLDNVVYRLGLGSSRDASRQLVRHNHILVNGKRRNIPSSMLSVGDKVTLVESSRNMPPVLASLESVKREGHSVPAWLKWESGDFTGELIARPSREDISVPVREQAVVELYSK